MSQEFFKPYCKLCALRIHDYSSVCDKCNDHATCCECPAYDFSFIPEQVLHGLRMQANNRNVFSSVAPDILAKLLINYDSLKGIYDDENS